MISVACVLKSGGIYTPEHVRILEAMVSRNLDGIDRFVCLTDTRLDLPHVERIHLYHNWPRAWSKLELFRPVFEEGERILYFDLPTVIIGSLSSIAASRDRFVSEKGVMLWTAGLLSDVYRAAARNPQRAMQESAQKFIYRYWAQPARWSSILPGHVVSYAEWLEMTSSPRVITFPGPAAPWTATDEGVRRHYTAEVPA